MRVSLKPLFGLLSGFLVLVASSGAVTTLPSGFFQTAYSPFTSPTAMAVAPDGRVFVCEQAGKLQVLKGFGILFPPFLALTVDSAGDRGLLGVALDPNFETNQYVYVYYTVPGSPAHNRVSRFTGNGDVAAPGSEVVLLELDGLSASTENNGGALRFGLDGKLYIAVGENANPSNAQTLDNLLGKILRINADGTIPGDNPFVGAAPPARHEIWSLGHRNPFTFAVQPFTGRIFVNDVGESTWEEIDDELAGLNYGWPTCEGPFLTGTSTPCNDPLFTDPISWYDHSGACAIAGAAFYNPQEPRFPAEYFGNYFFADYCGDWIKRLDPATGAVVTFATGISAPVGLEVDGEGDLYYLARGDGTLYKVYYSGSNAPWITQNPANQAVPSGFPATFDVSVIGAPPLSYQWQRDGVDIPGASAASYTIAAAGPGDFGHQFQCVVSNAFPPSATSAPATLVATTDLPPTATISAPPSGTTYAAGDTIAYAGSGTDPEDGALPPSAMIWWVNFHHDTHLHAFIPPTSGSAGGSFVIPVLGETSPNVWYRIHLRVTDAMGSTNETYRDVTPRTSTMTLASVPAGLQLQIDLQPVTTPMDIVSVVNMMRFVIATPTQPLGGITYYFVSWSDGGAGSHFITVPPTDATFTAQYVAGPSPTPTATPTSSIPTPSRTPTPTPSALPTATHTPTATPTPEPMPAPSGIAPTSGTAAGGTGVMISGSGFLPGAVVQIGGVYASGVFIDSGHMSATAPSLSPGSLKDVKVLNPGGLSGTLANGWFVDFLDVPQSNIFHADVEKVRRNGVTAGCGSGDYCPTALVTRAQMAVFLLKGEHGGGYTPPPCTTTVFSDVACPGGPNVDWVNQLAAEGVTGGCGGGKYCPSSSLTRAQMAVFLLKGKHGGSFLPPACSATVFADVPCPGAPFVDWINQLGAESITAGCGSGNYCPAAGTPREQMATFLVRTFSLP